MRVIDIVEEVDQQILGMFEDEIVDQDHDHQEIVMTYDRTHRPDRYQQRTDDRINGIQDLVHHHQSIRK